jgi:DNA gyrase/topoisomerase IV subunit A
MQTRDDDQVRQLFVASTHDNVLFLPTGRVLRCRAWEFPTCSAGARTALINIGLEPDERITSSLTIDSFEAAATWCWQLAGEIAYRPQGTQASARTASRRWTWSRTTELSRRAYHGQ